jgi:hypothetical protein
MSNLSKYALTPHKNKHDNLAEIAGVVHLDVAELNERGITELNINNKKKGEFFNCCGRKFPKKSTRFIAIIISCVIAFSFFIARAAERGDSFTDVISELGMALLLLITPSFLEPLFPR